MYCIMCYVEELTKDTVPLLGEVWARNLSEHTRKGGKEATSLRANSAALTTMFNSLALTLTLSSPKPCKLDLHL